MKYLLDSDIIIDLLAGNTRVQRVLGRLSNDGIGVSIVSYGEIFEGAYYEPFPALKLAIYGHMLSTYQLVSLNIDIMENFGRIRSSLRRAGQLIPDVDLQIAATALTLDLTLVTRNRKHFARIPGLNLYDATAAI